MFERLTFTPIVDAEADPTRVMNDFKTYSSRSLKSLGLDPPDRRRWARHGSTRWLWNPESISTAINYVIEAQGEPMAVFRAHTWDRLAYARGSAALVALLSIT